ncbi:unnamed protein product [Pocillopora meandrina]|uniref:Uncharacterized protein n=1 Tax=Pocillopora meandrina TaxID=46732 RepID=A0AAU9WQ53_9CNID|nr:unnamed protein product [Pocillopora meandrina]
MPQADLPIYRGVPSCFSIIVAVLSFGGASSFPYAVIFLIFGFPFIALYLQSEMVNRKSLPLVRKQPLKNGLLTLNVLYEVTVAKLEMIALSSYEMKIGLLKTNSGRDYFQVFHPAAFRIMDEAKRTSRIILGVFLFLAVYNTIITFLYSFKIMKD